MEELSSQPKLDYSSAYYDPPAVPWWGLLILFALLRGIASLLPDAQIWLMVVNLLWALWCVYICLWLRRLNPNSMALFWILAFTGLELTYDVVALRIDPRESLLPALLALAYAVPLIIGIYVIRAELERHYNRQEDRSLTLGPFMTFFFSFVYFQYHLYDIAEARRREREALSASV